MGSHRAMPNMPELERALNTVDKSTHSTQAWMTFRVHACTVVLMTIISKVL